MVWSPDGDIEYFDINAGVLQGDTLAPLLFIITLDYELRTSIDENKARQVEIHMEITTQHSFKEEILQSRCRICFIIRL